jgi:formate hydrogenlyase subunit 3/multisubunit Na+/H+ antiporter MnhD subunit
MLSQNFFLNQEPAFLFNFSFLIFFPLIIYLLSLIFKNDNFLKIFGPISLIGSTFIYIFQFFLNKDFSLFYESEKILRISFFERGFLNFQFAFNFFGICFLIISYILCFLTLIYSISYCKSTNLSFSKLARLIFLAIFSVNLIALADNAVLSFIGYEILSFVTYFLITLPNHDTNAPYVGKQYLNFLVVFSSVFFVLTLILIGLAFNWDFDFHFLTHYNVFENTEHQYFLYSLIIFLICFASIKAAMFPFHFWLPNAMVAHLPVSSVLHAALVVKSGILVIFQIIFFKIGLPNLEFISEEGNNFSFNLIQVPKILSGIGVVFLSFMATRKSEIKRILAYSTAAQLNYILLSFFNIICDKKDLSFNFESLKQIEIFVLIQIFVHAFAKINLFFCAGYFYEKYKIKYKHDYKGLFFKEKILSIIFLFSCFSMIGFPFLPGFFNKISLIELIINSKSIFSLICILFGFVLSLYYFLPILYDMFFATRNAEESNSQKVTNVNLWSMKLAIILCFLIFFISLIKLIPNSSLFNLFG